MYGIGQKDIIARHVDALDKIEYDGNIYVQYTGVWDWSPESDMVLITDGDAWVANVPYHGYRTKLYADNDTLPNFIYVRRDLPHYVREDYEFPSIWETTCSTIVTQKANLWDSPTYKFHFTDNNGALLKLTPEQIVDTSFGFTYSERPEKFIEIGYVMLYWSEYPCLYYSSSIHFDGNDYYMDLLGSPDPLVKENLYYKIKNEQFIEYCKTLYIDG